MLIAVHAEMPVLDRALAAAGGGAAVEPLRVIAAPEADELAAAGAPHEERPRRRGAVEAAEAREIELGGVEGRIVTHGRGQMPDDLLGGEAGELRHHVDHGRRRVGIGLDVQALEQDAAGHEEAEEQEQHQHALLQGHANEGLHR